MNQQELKTIRNYLSSIQYYSEEIKKIIDNDENNLCQKELNENTAPSYLETLGKICDYNIAIQENIQDQLKIIEEIGKNICLLGIKNKQTLMP